MNTAGHLEELEGVASRFSEALALVEMATGTLTEPVPTCPGWAVRDLVEHVGGIYRWVTQLVDQAITVETWRSSMRIDYPQSDEAVLPWFVASLGPLLGALRAAPQDGAVWAWGADPYARFWSRRMLHETTVHLADLLGVSGQSRAISGDVAVDGIDEFLINLPCTARWGAPIDLLRGKGESLILRATDRTETWRLRFDPTGFWWDRGSDAADATLSGPIADLYLQIQGRDQTTVQALGRTDVIERWQSVSEFS